MTTSVHLLFKKLDQANIRYCLWKSYDRWDEGLQGQTDIDLLLDPQKLDVAFDLLQSGGWIKLNAESWRRFPNVWDYVKFNTDTLKWIHLHIHGQIVTGEKLTKSFTPPWTDLYLDKATREPWPSHIVPDIEFIAFILRLSIKLTWVEYARIIRRRSSKMIYRDFFSEYEDLRKRASRPKILEYAKLMQLSKRQQSIVVEAYDDLYSLNLPRRLLLAQFVGKHRRLGYLERKAKTFWKSLQRRYQGVGKRCPNKGLSIAVCGADGSGKTTLVIEIEKNLKEHFMVSRFYMGGKVADAPLRRAIFIYPLMAPYLIVRKLAKTLHFKEGASFMEKLYFGFNDWLIYRDKKDYLKEGSKTVDMGGVALFERYPIFPQFGDGVSGEENFFKTKEMKIFFEQIALPDLLVIIDVDAHTAKMRRPEDSPDIIDEKVAAFHNFAIQNNTSHVMVLPGDNTVHDNLQSVLSQIEKDLHHANRQEVSA